MQLKERLRAFVLLGNKINSLDSSELAELSFRAQNGNNWFTPKNVASAMQAIATMLQEDKLADWASRYTLADHFTNKKIGIVMAGNIPAVGFHDWFCTLLAGHEAHIKPSTLDTVLMRWLANQLAEISPELGSKTVFSERMNHIDAVIATGSDNSSRYFEYYFAKKPHIIRHNRTSVAVLTGHETPQEIQSLGRDIFDYYGLGCRNVSKVYVPENYNFTLLLDAFAGYAYVQENHKYNNNYDYNKSIYLVNGVPHLDTGFLLVTESQELVSPISVLFYEKYADVADLQTKLTDKAHKIQCVVGKEAVQIPFGQAQCPNLDDYADGVDTMLFLTQKM